jgi:hypothetical protein
MQAGPVRWLNAARAAFIVSVAEQIGNETNANPSITSAQTPVISLQ